MLKNVFVYSYKAGSASARELATELEVRRIRHDNSSFRPRGKTVINWGASRMPDWADRVELIINNPVAVATAANKLSFFQLFQDQEEAPRVPDWTTEKATAAAWYEEKPDQLVFARTQLNGNSGQGIVKVASSQELETIDEGTLLVKYVKKAEEYRLHYTSAADQPFLVQQKRRRMGLNDEDVDYQIRNSDNGFVFARQDLEVPDDVFAQALKAFKLSGLDFGALDVIYNARYDKAYVLEANTAPGLEGTTTFNYAEALRGLLQ